MPGAEGKDSSADMQHHRSADSIVPCSQAPSSQLPPIATGRHIVSVGMGAGKMPFQATSIGSYSVEVQSAVQEIDLSYAIGISDEVVASIARNSPRLRSFRAAHAEHLTCATTTALGLFCHKLGELHLELCSNIKSPMFSTTVARVLASQARVLMDGPMAPRD